MYTFPTFPDSTLVFNIPEKMTIETPKTKGIWLASGYASIYEEHLLVGVEQKDGSRESTVYLMTAHNKKPVILKIRDKRENGVTWREIDMPKDFTFTKGMTERTGIEGWEIWDCFKSIAFTLDDALLRAKAGEFHIINGKIEREDPGKRFPRGMRIIDQFAMNIPGDMDSLDTVDDMYEKTSKNITDSFRGISEDFPAYFAKKKSGSFEAEAFEGVTLGWSFGFRVHRESFYELLALLQKESIENLRKMEIAFLEKTKNTKRWVIETGNKKDSTIIGKWNDIEPAKN